MDLAATAPALALVTGASLALVFGNPWVATTRKISRHVLAAAVVGLGAGMDLRAVARAGAHGAVFAAVGIAVSLLLGTLLARVLRVERDTGLLVSVGTAICGGSAIAAVAPTLRARDHEVAVALATVFVLNGVALVAFPLVGHAVGLDEEQFGLWAALGIHDTSSVVGASMAYGAHAFEVATTVKLARALWIVPVTLAIGFARRRNDTTRGDAPAKTTAPKPWFIAGFVLAAAACTLIPSLRPAGAVVSALAKHAITAALFLIGAGLTRPALRAAGLRPLAHGLVVWILVATLSLGAVVFHWS
jgi:uncharacterized integral membrane protein (TIGR00698 family)